MHFLPKMKHLTALASADRAIILMALPDQVLRPILEFFHGAAISRAKIVSEKLVPEKFPALDHFNVFASRKR